MSEAPSGFGPRTCPALRGQSTPLVEAAPQSARFCLRNGCPDRPGPRTPGKRELTEPRYHEPPLLRQQPRSTQAGTCGRQTRTEAPPLALRLGGAAPSVPRGPRRRQPRVLKLLLAGGRAAHSSTGGRWYGRAVCPPPVSGRRLRGRTQWRRPPQRERRPPPAPLPPPPRLPGERRAAARSPEASPTRSRSRLRLLWQSRRWPPLHSRTATLGPCPQPECRPGSGGCG